MEAHELMEPGEPWLRLFVGSPSDATDLALAITRAKRRQFAARWLRGAHMTTRAALFAEVAAALQFPWYFGDNWDALDECLADLDWLPAHGYVLFILDAAEVLKSETPAERQIFWSILERAAKEWSEPRLERPRRAAKVFRVVVQCAAGEEGQLRDANTLAGLLRQIKPESIRGETDWGPATGREAW